MVLRCVRPNEVDVIQISAVPLINASLRGFDAVFVAGMLLLSFVREEPKRSQVA